MPHVSTPHLLGTWPVSRQHVFSAQAQHSPQSGPLVGRLTAPVTDRVIEQAGEGAWVNPSMCASQVEGTSYEPNLG